MASTVSDPLLQAHGDGVTRVLADRLANTCVHGSLWLPSPRAMNELWNGELDCRRLIVAGHLCKTVAMARAFGAGILERTVDIEFDSVDQAVAAYESRGYQDALRVLGDGAERDLRIVEAVS